jgi:hypothetical protein
MNDKKDFLSEILPQINYIMSYTTEILIPVSSLSEITAKEVMNKKDTDPFAHLIHHAIVEIILDIAKSSKKAGIVFGLHKDDFQETCIEISKLLQSRNPSIQFWREKSLEVLEKYQKRISRRFEEPMRTKALYIVEVLTEYCKTASVISEYRKKELDEAIRQIDYEEFKNSIYGTLLTFICLSIASDSKGKKLPHIHNTIQPLTDLGYPLAETLDSYIDTLDILTNPTELELFHKTDSEIQ